MTRNQPRRILAIGSATWSDRTTTTKAIQRVMAVYRDPYQLVVDLDTGYGRYAAAAARAHGWEIVPYTPDVKCGPECPLVGHRRRGGPEGTFCPTGRLRAFTAQLELGADLVLVLHRVTTNQPAGTRLGQSTARDRGIAVWEYSQTRGN